MISLDLYLCSVVLSFSWLGVRVPRFERFFLRWERRSSSNRSLTSRNNTRVFIQNGEMLDRRDVNVSAPHCQFILHRPRGASGGLSIQPDTFTVDRTFRESQRGTVNATMITFMNISSEAQPEVSQLACQRWGSPRLDSFLTIKEMQKTLAPIVDLSIAAQ